MLKQKSVGFISPQGINRRESKIDRFKLYSKEKEEIKKEFAGLSGIVNWKDPVVQAKLSEFANQIVKNTSQTVLGTPDLLSLLLPVEPVMPGDTFVLRELHGVNVYYGTYGASVRMSRPQFTQYSTTTNVKEVGIKLEMTQIRTGKYSPSELADYTAALINAWRNNLFFRTTLGGMSVYGSGGAQYTAGTGGTSFGTINAALNKVTDEGDISFIVGRRNAIALMSTMTGWSDTVIDEYKEQGMIGKFAGIPVMRVNSFTDPDYGTVYPMDNDQLWFFSALPAGRMVQADALRTNDEIIAQNETMNLYFRWDDGIGIYKTDRIAVLDAMVV